MGKRKNKTKINFGRFLTVIACLLLVVVLIVVSICSCSNNRQNSSTPSGSNQSAISDSISDVSSSEPNISYEQRVGKKYQIDIKPYLQYIEPGTEEYLFLVNPKHKLSKDYVPDDLVDCGITRKDGRKTQMMRATPAKALEAMMKEAKLNGVKNVTATSAYRSYEYQEYLFNLYCDQNQSRFATREECEKYVLTFSTNPGTSEHQSGLCIDMHNLPSAEISFGEKPEAKWLAENCYRFGFILRYAADKREITNIIYEPWHFRFVGREFATEMHEKNMCLEEYIEYKRKS